MKLPASLVDVCFACRQANGFSHGARMYMPSVERTGFSRVLANLDPAAESHNSAADTKQPFDSAPSVFILGISLAGIIVLVSTTDICIPSMIYNILFLRKR